MKKRFDELGLPEELVTALADQGITDPFPVQELTIPDAVAGRDVCGKAKTGSGKTLAFGLPLLARLEGAADPARPRALVLVPTRELAGQVTEALDPLARAMGRRVVAVYGGADLDRQVKRLRDGADIVVATPGRMIDLLDRGDVALDDLQGFVLDEADRMADMGFLPEVERILDRTADNRQTTLFSATLDGDVAVLTQRYQRDPVRHEVGSAEPDLTTMTHHFWKLDPSDRVACAAEVIMAAGPTVVFSRTRHGADRIARQLAKLGVVAVAIHGGRNQRQRDRALDAFAGGEAFALVATDVAARGIHVDGVNCVLHFDPPEDDKTYLHRSGRTARAGESGVVVSFVAPDQVRQVQRMQRQLGLPEQLTAPTPRGIDAPAAVRQPTARPARASEYHDAPADPHGVRDRGPGQPAGRREARSSAGRTGAATGAGPVPGRKPGAGAGGGKRRGAAGAAGRARSGRGRRG